MTQEEIIKTAMFKELDRQREEKDNSVYCWDGVPDEYKRYTLDGHFYLDKVVEAIAAALQGENKS